MDVEAVLTDDLIDRWRIGDPAARGTLLTCLEELMRRAAQRRLPGFAARLDYSRPRTSVAHDAWIPLTEWLDGVGRAKVSDAQHFKALAATSVRNVLLNLVRTAARRPVGALPADGIASPLETDYSPWLKLTESVERLPADEREAIERHHYLDETLEQIAAAMKVSRATVGRLLKQARDRLKEFGDPRLE